MTCPDCDPLREYNIQLLVEVIALLESLGDEVKGLDAQEPPLWIRRRLETMRQTLANS